MSQAAAALELAIDDLAADGRGVGRNADGKTVFVADCLPGETIRYRRLRGRRRHDEGALLGVLRPAPERTEPRCAHFGVCGGCALQHLEPGAQLQIKQAQLLAALARVGKVTPEQVLPALAGPAWGYRRRARLGVKHVANKGTLVGFRERRSSFVAVLSACPILVPEVGQRILALQRLVDGLSVKARLPQIEVAVGDDHGALVLRVLEQPSSADLDSLRAFQRETGLWLYLQRGGVDTVAPLEPGAPPLSYRLPHFDLTVGFAPTDFIQVNARVNALMVDQAVRLLEPAAGERVLDLFAGIGNFGLALARRGAQVDAVEGEATLVARSAANARANGLDKLQAHRSDLFTPDPQAAWLQGQVDKVMLDPPRSGARELLPLVAAKAPARILYCSCHPASLARDAGELVHRYGYRLAAAGAVDMFPHTAHVESMALFVRD